MLQYTKIDVSEEVYINKKSVRRKNVFFVVIGILKMLDLNLNCLFVINLTMN